ncbi:DUF3515 domain-containing protein [Gulosibacter sp. ACHW.36C]|uniref:DUF3515 domain-containing protein n=1 Tax=Gulosibacter sediminis TaxID=1729695 RepID=A0ABY4MZ44_9MICO|nr:DUF3515 domain-containing protein [Gulosibacter sediminis]UQN15342.1 DUF3515 domain-containing protein [Gulosibacter sediminis]
MSRFSLRPLAALTIAGIAVLLSGCSGPSVAMQPAESAAAPECADVTVRLPDTVDGLEKRETNAQATGAWGNPASVLLRCGVPSPGPTSDRCISLNGIDWIEDASEAPTYRYTSYGRTPAVEVAIDSSTGVSGTNALIDLQDAVGMLPQTGECVGPDDLLNTP